MKPIRLLQRRTALTALIVGGLLFTGLLAAQEKKRDGNGWSELSEADQKKLREALRTVWSDPTVLSARENVNRSALEYHRAIRELIGKQDPATALLLDRVQKNQSGVLNTAIGDVRKKHFHPISGARLTQIIAPPAMMERMAEDQKVKFQAAGARAKELPKVVEAIEELKNLSKEDEEIRMKKMEAFRKFRKVYFEAIVEIEPELKALMPSPGGPSAPFGGKGKGNGVKSPPKPD